MIKKYLNLGKQVSLTSTRLEIKSEVQRTPPVELRLPIEVFWEAEKIVKKAEFQQSQMEDARKVKDTNIELFKLVLPYVLHEKDRATIQELIDLV